MLPFIKFPGVDTVLGPEMKSTGEVMGIDSSYGMAFAKSQLSANGFMPLKGTAFISVKDKDKPAAVKIARELHYLGFKIIATGGTAKAISDSGTPAEKVLKVMEGRPHIVDKLKSGEVALVINTPIGKSSLKDSYSIRRTALVCGIPYCTTVAGAFAAVNGIKAIKQGHLDVLSLQEYHGKKV